MKHETTFVQKLARRAANIRFNSIPDETRHLMKWAVLDRLGCGLGAKRLGIGEELLELLVGAGGPAESTLWGDGRKVSSPHAALANGAISSHLEFDSHDSMIPAAIALAETRHIEGRDLMVSLVAGYQVGGIVRKLLASDLEKHGLHWPAHLAVFPSTTACSRILGLDADRTADALALVGCLSPVSPFEAFTRGAGIKDFYGGWGNMLGIVAARLGEAGISGPDTLFEGERGLGRIWLGRPPSTEQLEAALLDEGSARPRVHIKPYPGCTATHPALSALELILAEHPDISPDDVSSIEVLTYDFGAALSEASSFDTPISAKTNIPFLVSAMITYGQLLPEHTERPCIEDQGLRKLAMKVEVRPLSDSRRPLYERSRPAIVRIRLRGGVQLEASVEDPKWNTVNPPSDEEVSEKFRRLVGDLLSEDQREELHDTIMDLENVADVREIAELTIP